MPSIAIVGATGNVGRKILEVLESSAIHVETLHLYASQKSAGQTLLFKDTPYTIKALKEENIAPDIDYALFSAGGHISTTYAPLFTQQGITVIDNSSAYRMQKNVPLIVPEINASSLREERLIANPNCSTIQAVLPLKIIDTLFELSRVSYTTYQAVSGSGQGGIDDLENGMKGEAAKNYPKAIYNNVLPHIDTFQDDGYTFEEHKMINETKKILNLNNLALTATCVRVPVFNGHGVAIQLETKQPIHIETLNKALREAPGIKLYEADTYPTPQDANGTDLVHVGRIRKDPSVQNGLHLWCVADNLRKGAASNAVQILQYLLEEKS